MSDVFMGDFYEPPYFAECDECGSTLGEEGDCIVCIEADRALGTIEWDEAA